MLVVSLGNLIAALEIKSQRGPSFGNNFNNRTEEAIGMAHDLWTAYREGAFGKNPRPWLGWVMLLEDCPKSTTPVKVAEPHFKVFPEFRGASYAKRYELLLQRLVREKLFDRSAFLTSTDKQARTSRCLHRARRRSWYAIVSSFSSWTRDGVSGGPEMRSASQLPFDVISVLPKRAYEYGARSSGETHGVVLTKPHVVSLILDLAGYTVDRNLTALSLLEPACGHGAFLVQAVDRLLSVARRVGVDVADLQTAITAYDVDEEHVASSREAVAGVLQRHGVQQHKATSVAAQWILQDDFLLKSQAGPFDVIVGNPPYVRIEQLAPVLQAEYRRRYRSLYDRADLYVAFIEHALHLLSPMGVFSFICADRWTVNKYGAPLRQMLTEGFHVDCYVDLHTASPFESEVVAYPSIFAIGSGAGSAVHVCRLATASPAECAAVAPALRTGGSSQPGVTIATYDSWFEGSEPWVISSPEHLAALRSLEARFSPIEASGHTRVRIGVATGDDKTYIVGEDADVEPDRLVPLVMRDDIGKGTVRDARRFVINTFEDHGGVIDLQQYPRLARYLTAREVDVKRRHVARKNPTSWFRTIDRVYPHLVTMPKLLVPDIAGANEVAFEPGRFHPHHNLYFVTSDEWDMEVLGGLLSSRIALFFVWSYAVKMRGSYLRFQAQYLRRIRLPAPQDLPATLARSIRTAFRHRDFKKLDELALKAYDIKALPEFDFVDTRT